MFGTIAKMSKAVIVSLRYFWIEVLLIVCVLLPLLLQSSHPDITVVAFLIFPAKTNNFNVESLRGHAVTKSLRDTLNDIQQKMGKRMYEVCLR
jgi:hypothetical protein